MSGSNFYCSIVFSAFDFLNKMYMLVFSVPLLAISIFCLNFRDVFSFFNFGFISLFVEPQLKYVFVCDP